MTQGRVSLGGHSLRYADTGRGEPVFFCIHGLADTLEVWDALAEPLAQRGRVVRIDQRGHGESGAPGGPCTREDLARDALAGSSRWPLRSPRRSASRASC